MAEPPTLAGAVGRPGPVFLRKLRRKNDWGDPATPLDERAADLVKTAWKCEPHPKSPFSVFLVETDEDFHRVVIGMNGHRPSPTAESDFIAMFPGDLEAVGVRAERCPGVTLCAYANALHHDIPAKDEQLFAICRLLIERDLAPIHLSKGKIRPLVVRATEEGCLAVPNSSGCKVERCA